MMKKMLFLMLFLMFLGAVNVSSQVRIGGNEKPNDAAVLDLNADNNTNTGTKGLALPRVRLSDKTAKLDGVTANIKGMLVYNTGGSLAEGVYYWNGGTWIYTLDSYLLGGDSLVGLDKAQSGDALDYDGASWRVVPGYELINWVVPCDACRTGAAGAEYGVGAAYPPRCNYDTSWGQMRACTGNVNFQLKEWGLEFRRSTSASCTAVEVRLFCYRTTR